MRKIRKQIRHLIGDSGHIYHGRPQEPTTIKMSFSLREGKLISGVTLWNDSEL